MVLKEFLVRFRPGDPVELECPGDQSCGFEDGPETYHPYLELDVKIECDPEV
jgi:hypothetical protein